MKKILLLLFVAFFCLSVFSQTRHAAQQAAVKPSSAISSLKPVAYDITPVYEKQATIPTGKTKAYPNEEQIGTSYYDLQTNSSVQNRIYAYPDGTIGAVWTMSQLTSHSDRGTGYNYFDGTSWGIAPSTRIESIRTGWPSYAPLGDGELVMAHDFTPGTGSLVMLTRSNKGTGTWNQSIILGPAGHQDLAWNRTVTSGTNHNTIHMIALTKPVPDGSVYQGLNGSIVYSRSEDMGVTWTVKDAILPGMDSSIYTGFSGDGYTWAPPMGDTIAFVAGDNWFDMFMMKSTDGGVNWTKTVIWEHPYQKYDLQNLFATDTFFCPDGSLSAMFDSDGILHLAFGIQRALCDTSSSTGQLGTFWFPYVDGIALWNENMSAFSSADPMNTLDPARLDSLGYIVGFTPDVNGNDTLDFVTPPAGEFAIGSYYLGMSSMPALHIDDNDQMFLFWSAPNELRFSTKNFRHIWLRSSSDMGSTWSDVLNITGSIAHNYDECVYPCVAPASDNIIHVLYQADDEPGTSIQGDPAHITVENRITYSEVAKIWLDVPEIPSVQFNVSQPYPNPSGGLFGMDIELNTVSDIVIIIYDISGKQVMNLPQGRLSNGIHKLSFNAAQLTGGIYFATVYAGDHSLTKKLIIR